MSNRLRIFLDGIILAFQLLSTVPISKKVEWDNARAKMSVAAYPIVGSVLGALLVFQWLILSSMPLIPPLVAVMWLLTFSIIFSGGLHLDGWTDFHDAVFSRRSRERKLEIMKDPRVGTFGVLGLLFVVSWRFIFIYELIAVHHSTILLALFSIPLIVRLLLGWQLLIGTFAKEDGMAVALKAAKTKGIMLVYGFWTLALAILFLFTYPSLLFLLVSGMLFLVVWQKWVAYQLGGITGDTIGAGAEGGETFLWGILWLLLLLGMV